MATNEQIVQAARYAHNDYQDGEQTRAARALVSFLGLFFIEAKDWSPEKAIPIIRAIRDQTLDHLEGRKPWPVEMDEETLEVNREVEDVLSAVLEGEWSASEDNRMERNISTGLL